jgi:hypothetical protein
MFVQPLLLVLAINLPSQTGVAFAQDDYPGFAGPAGFAGASHQQAADPRQLMCFQEPDYANQPPCKAASGRTTTRVSHSDTAVWSIDYRVRWLFESHTAYQFGTLPTDPIPYAPLSKLDWSLNSPWHGLQVGWQKPNIGIHFEWLAPQNKVIDGEMADFDWLTPTQPDQVDSLTHSSLRWYDGQMLDVSAEFKLFEGSFIAPIEFWPTGGFRFQRFNMIGYNLYYVVPPFGQLTFLDNVDVITFNQEYYIGYVGGQIRTHLSLGGSVPIDVRLEGDWGSTSAANVDHHLLREGDRFTMDTTFGESWHFAVIAEVPLGKCFSLGMQVDHQEIRTTGRHQLLNVPLNQDITWDNGVKVDSDQTSITVFMRANF